MAIVPDQMIANERCPCLRRASRPCGRLRHVLRDRALVDAVPNQRQFTRDSAAAPGRVLPGHANDERDDLFGQRRSSDRFGLARPNSSEAPAMPRNHRRGVHNRQGVRPARPSPAEHDPERAIERPKSRPRPVTAKNRKLLAQREVLDNETRARTQCREQGADDGLEQGDHAPNFALFRIAVTGESRWRIRYPGRRPLFTICRENSW
jgi:hypothetical protein